jgi:lipoprotein-releasing system permease protein
MYLLFAWRYFIAKKSTNAINIISWISILAIMVGTFALIVVLSVFNGFEHLVKSLYSSFYTDLKIMPASGKSITLTDEQLAKLKGIKGIKNYSLVVEEKAIAQNGDQQSLIYMKGVDDNYRYVTGVADHIVKGEYELGTADEPQLILGTGIEGALGVQAERNIFSLNVYLPRKSNSEQIDMLNDISNDSMRTSSAFQIQQDFDNKYGITNIEFMQRAMKWNKNQYSGAEITLQDPSAAEDIQKDVKKIFNAGYKVQTRYEQNQNFYSIMRLERWIIYAVLSLILVVASFTMIGALTMLVLEKQKDMSVLYSLGGNRQFIQKIFMSEGILLGMIGTFGGMLLAFLFITAQTKFHLIALEGGSFLIDYFPVKMKVTDFLLVAVTVFIIAFIASWLPSMKAARKDFSLRSE